MTNRPPLEADLPQLFGWGRFGIPGEVKSYIQSRDTTVRIKRGELPERSEIVGYTHPDYGIADIAQEMRMKLHEVRDRAQDRKQGKKQTGRNPKAKTEIAAWVYILHAICAEDGKPAPWELLWLTFEALDLSEFKPPAEITGNLDLPKVEKVEEFLKASAFDGEADAQGKALSLSKLEELTGVARSTLRSWRQLPQYQQRRDYVAYSEGKNFPDFGWTEIISKIKKEMID